MAPSLSTLKGGQGDDKLESRQFAFGASKGVVLVERGRKDVLDRVIGEIKRQYETVVEFVSRFPEFKDLLEPWDIEGTWMPPVIVRMVDSARKFDVGPMAAVAGAIVDEVVERFEGEWTLVVENGGEIRLRNRQPIVVALDAGESSIGRSVALEIPPGEPCFSGVGTSSATFGRGLSFGSADLVTAFCDSASDADAAATSICNATRGNTSREMVDSGLDLARKNGNVNGVIVVRGELVGTWGKIPRMVKLEGKDRRQRTSDPI